MKNLEPVNEKGRIGMGKREETTILLQPLRNNN